MKNWTVFLVSLTASPYLQAAVICNVQGNPTLNFGTVDPFTGGNTPTQVTFNWSCSRGFLESRQNTMCLYVGNDNSGTMLPRQLRPQSGLAPNLPFNVYDSPARVNVVGQPGGTVTNGIEINVSMPLFTFNDRGTVTLYGLLPAPLPGNTRAELHQAQMINSQVRVRTGGTGQSCDGVAPPQTSTYTLTAQVDISDQCQVTASDLDFGTQNTPLTQVDSTSSIAVRCSNATPFNVGLNNGSNGTRQMVNGGNSINYELYKDAGRSLVWGNSGSDRLSGTGQGVGNALNLTVFGRVFADPAAAPGNYVDTVTVEVTF